MLPKQDTQGHWSTLAQTDRMAYTWDTSGRLKTDVFFQEIGDQYTVTSYWGVHVDVEQRWRVMASSQ